MIIDDLLDKGGLIELGEGEYQINRPVKPKQGKPFVLRGKGVRTTVVRLTSESYPNENLISLEGGEDQAHYHSYFEISQLSIVGGPQGNERSVNSVLNFSRATLGLIFRVEIAGFIGQAIRAYSLWDTHLYDVQISRCGVRPTIDAPIGMPAVEFLAASTVPGSNENCNNIIWKGGRIENCPFTGIVLHQACTKFFLSLKMHGEIPVPAPYPHLVLDGAYGNVVGFCNFANGGGDGVLLTGGSYGNMIAGNVIANMAGHGIYEDKTCLTKKKVSMNYIGQQVWPVPLKNGLKPNLKGDYVRELK